MSPSNTGEAIEPVALIPAQPSSLNGWSTQWRDTVRGLLLVRAEAIVAAQRPTTGAARLSIAVLAKALTDIDLLLAGCRDIDLADVGTAEGHSHAMNVRPIPLNVLSSAPVVEVHASGMTDPARLRLAVHLYVRDRRTGADSLITRELSDVILTPRNPLARFDFPLEIATPDGTARRVV